MKVRFTNGKRGTYVNSSSSLTIGRNYHVLAIYSDYNGILEYRIIGDDSYTPGLHDAQQFEIVSPIIPKNWIVNVSAKRFFELAPEAWTRLGFWEEYFDGDEKAIEIFENERQIIIESDP